MTDYDIHSCGYYCDRHACILRQRDELRDKLFEEIRTSERNIQTSDSKEAESSQPWVKTYSGGKPNYTQPIEQEPVGNTVTFMTRAIFNVVATHQEINGGYFIADGDIDYFVERLAKVINSTFEPLKPKNTASPQREWVGLTGQETNHLLAANVDCAEKLIRAIEAKLKEKNA